MKFSDYFKPGDRIRLKPGVAYTSCFRGNKTYDVVRNRHGETGVNCECVLSGGSTSPLTMDYGHAPHEFECVNASPFHQDFQSYIASELG